MCRVIFVLFDAEVDVLAIGFGAGRNPVHGDDFHPIGRMEDEFFSQHPAAASEGWF